MRTLDRRDFVKQIGFAGIALGAGIPVPSLAEVVPQDSDLEHCVQTCAQCILTCEETILFCLEQEGHHAPEHMRILLDCVGMCRACFGLLTSHSPFTSQVCALCVQTCLRCAESCEKFGDATMDRCAKACRNCAETCQHMAS